MAEDQQQVEEEPGDPAPPPSRVRGPDGRYLRDSSGSSAPPKPKRGPGRPPGAKNKPKPPPKGPIETMAEGAEDAAEEIADAPRSRRTSREARAGGAVAWGLMGTGVQVGGQVGGAPGLVAAGWVMQAQAKEGGIMLAQRLLETRWYPYLEKLGRGGAGNAALVAPIMVAVYVQVKPARPLVEPVIAGMLSKTIIEVPDTAGQLVKVPLWKAIREETAMQDQLDAQALAEAEAMAAATGNGQPQDVPEGWVPPVHEEPEPGVDHIRSRYNDLADQPGGYGPGEI